MTEKKFVLVIYESDGTEREVSDLTRFVGWVDFKVNPIDPIADVQQRAALPASFQVAEMVTRHMQKDLIPQ